jgi:hypothetical protein
LNGSKTVVLTVGAIQINSLTVYPTSLYGGVGNAVGLIYLTQSAPSGGAVVALASSDPALTVPATITIPQGSTYALFTITSHAVSENATVTITATLNNAKTGTITVRPVKVQNVSSSPSSLIGGSGTVTGTVYLNENAPEGGAVVQLASDNASATVPGTVTVQEGRQSATFTISTSAVAAEVNATITATYNGTATTTFKLQVPQVSSVAISNSSVIGGTSVTGTVTINVAAPSEGLTVNVSDDKSAAGTPSTVTIPAGQTSTTFEITTAAVSSNTTVIVTASFGGSSVNAQFTVNRPVLTSIAISPTSTKGGNKVTVTITLSGPAPTGGMSVTLSDNSSKISTPASASVPAGQTQVSYSSTTSTVTSGTTVTVTASLNGVSKTADVYLTRN